MAQAHGGQVEYTANCPRCNTTNHFRAGINLTAAKERARKEAAAAAAAASYAERAQREANQRAWSAMQDRIKKQKQQQQQQQEAQAAAKKAEEERRQREQQAARVAERKRKQEEACRREAEVMRRRREEEELALKRREAATEAARHAAGNPIDPNVQGQRDANKRAWQQAQHRIFEARHEEPVCVNMCHPKQAPSKRAREQEEAPTTRQPPTATSRTAATKKATVADWLGLKPATGESTF